MPRSGISKCEVLGRFNYLPVFRKGARALPPNFLGRNVDRKRESGEIEPRCLDGV